MAQDAAIDPKAYIVAEIAVSNPEPYQEYVDLVTPVVAQYGGGYTVRGGKMESIEGEPVHGRMVILDFPSLDQAKAFFNSPEYKAIVPLRRENSTSRVYVVEGPTP